MLGEGNGQEPGVPTCKMKALPVEQAEKKMRAAKRTHRDLIVPKSPQSSSQPHNSGLRVLLPLTPRFTANAPDPAQACQLPTGYLLNNCSVLLQNGTRRVRGGEFGSMLESLSGSVVLPNLRLAFRSKMRIASTDAMRSQGYKMLH